MSVLGSVSIEVGLDERSLDSQLDLLEKRKIKPLRLIAEVDAAALQRQIKQISLDPIKVDLSPNVEDFQLKLKKVSKLVDCIPVKLCPDIEDLQSKLKKLDPIKVNLSPDVGDFQEKLRRASKLIDCIPVRLCPDVDDLLSKLKQLPQRLDPIKIDLSPDVGDFQEKLKRVNKLVDSIPVRLCPDIGDFQDRLRRATKIEPIAIEVDLNTQRINEKIAKIGKIAVQVDHEPLTKLNQHLDSKLAHVKELQQYFDANPLKIIVDDRQIRNRKDISLVGGNSSINLSTELKSDSLVKEIVNAIERGFKRNSGGGIFSFAKGLIGEAIKGAAFSVGMPTGEKIGGGVARQIDSKVDLDALGEKMGQLIVNRTQDIAETTSKIINAATVGVIGRSLPEITEAVNKFLDEVSFSVSGLINEDVEGQLVEFFKHLVDPQLYLQEIGNDVVAIADSIKQGTVQQLKDRRKAKITEIAELAKKQAESLAYTPKEGTNSVAIVSGGFAGEKGQSGQGLVSQLEFLLGEGVHVVPTENKFTDVPASIKEGAISWTASAGARLLESQILQAFNPDAIEMAAKAIAVKSQEPDKPVQLVGYSAGGYVAQEALAILQHLGIKNVQATAIGTPTNIGVPLDSSGEDFKAFLGDNDGLQQFVKAMKVLGATSPAAGNLSLEGVEGHNFEAYLGKEEVQSRLGQMGQLPETDISDRSAFDVVRMTKNFQEGYQQVLGSINVIASAKSPGMQQMQRDLLKNVLLPQIQASRMEAAKLSESAPLESVKSQAAQLTAYYAELQNLINNVINDEPFAKVQEFIIQLLKEVTDISNIDYDFSNTPILAVERLGEGVAGAYNFLENTLRIDPSTFREIAQSQNLDDISKELIETLVHELRHSVQKYAPTLMNMTYAKHKANLSDEQRLNLKQNARASVEESLSNVPEGTVVSNQAIATAYKREIDAYLFELLATEQIIENLKDSQKQFNETLENASTPLPTVNSEISPAFSTKKKLPDLSQLKTTSAQIEEGVEAYEEIFNNAEQLPEIASDIDQLKARAAQIEQGFKEYTEVFRNQVQAAQELGDFDFVDNESQSFIIYAARAKKELEEIRQALVNLGAIEKGSSSNEASKAKGAITTATKQLQREFGKSKNPRDFVGGVQKELEKLEKDGVKIGENLPQAIALGISNTSDEPAEEARKLMLGVEVAAKEQAEIRSPSRVFQRIGEFISEGSALGIEQGAKSVQDAMRSVMQGIEQISIGDPLAQVQQLQQETAQATDNFEKLFAEIAKLSGVDPSSARTPGISFLDIPGTSGNYDAERNQVILSKNRTYATVTSNGAV